MRTRPASWIVIESGSTPQTWIQDHSPVVEGTLRDETPDRDESSREPVLKNSKGPDSPVQDQPSCDHSGPVSQMSEGSGIRSRAHGASPRDATSIAPVRAASPVYDSEIPTANAHGASSDADLSLAHGHSSDVSPFSPREVPTRDSESHHLPTQETPTAPLPTSVKPVLTRSMSTKPTVILKMLVGCQQIHITPLLTKPRAWSINSMIFVAIPGAGPNHPSRAQRGAVRLGLIPRVSTTGTLLVRKRSTPRG